MIKEEKGAQPEYTMILEHPLMESAKPRFKGKFKRVIDIIGPSDESMAGFGVMSAENPMGQQSSPFDNERRMKQLMDLLKQSDKKVEMIQGRFFNNDENSIVIPDVNIREMAGWSSNKDWPQHSFIFGKKEKLAEDVIVHYYFVELKYDDSYEMAGYQITDYRTSVFKNADIQQRSDMFSQAGGKKFYIPFFDESEEIGGEPHVVPQGLPPNPTNQ
jgi:hypothetical protein